MDKFKTSLFLDKEGKIVKNPTEAQKKNLEEAVVDIFNYEIGYPVQFVASLDLPKIGLSNEEMLLLETDAQRKDYKKKSKEWTSELAFFPLLVNDMSSENSTKGFENQIIMYPSKKSENGQEFYDFKGCYSYRQVFFTSKFATEVLKARLAAENNTTVENVYLGSPICVALFKTYSGTKLDKAIAKATKVEKDTVGRKKPLKPFILTTSEFTVEIANSTIAPNAFDFKVDFLPENEQVNLIKEWNELNKASFICLEHLAEFLAHDVNGGTAHTWVKRQLKAIENSPELVETLWRTIAKKRVKYGYVPLNFDLETGEMLPAHEMDLLEN